MTLVDLDSLKNWISNGGCGLDERSALSKLLITVLAKGSRVDLHTDEAEVELIQRVVEEYTGEKVEAAAIRTEAIMQARDESLKPIAKLSSSVSRQHRALVIRALMGVLRADTRVSHAEIEFFNGVAAALDLSFAEVAGLVEE